jgi:hypothetical protein
MPIQHLRFKPDPMDQAFVEFRSETADFKPQCCALIINESFSGSALVLQSPDTILPEKEIRVKIGRLEPMRAEIIWVKILDKDIYKIGIQFLE